MEDFEKNEVKRDSDTVFSQLVKAGKRTYFFDVKTTRGNEHYITITESKKVFEDNGNSHYEKHKIFLYKEDFEKFTDSLNEVFQYIKNNSLPADDVHKNNGDQRFTDVNFEDLA